MACSKVIWEQGLPHHIFTTSTGEEEKIPFQAIRGNSDEKRSSQVMVCPKCAWAQTVEV